MSKGVRSVIVARPNDATPYGAGDVVGGLLTFAGLGDGAPFYIVGAELLIESAALIASEASYSLELYSAAPATPLADNAQWDLVAADRGIFLGEIVVGTPVDKGSTLYVRVDTPKLHVGGGILDVYAYLTTAGGYTPVAQRVFRVKLHKVNALVAV